MRSKALLSDYFLHYIKRQICNWEALLLTGKTTAILVHVSLLNCIYLKQGKTMHGKYVLLSQILYIELRRRLMRQFHLILPRNTELCVSMLFTWPTSQFNTSQSSSSYQTFFSAKQFKFSYIRTKMLLMNVCI